MAAITASTVYAGIAIGGAVLGGIGSLRGSRGQAKAQEAQADLTRQTGAEAARRMERGQERTLGEATAGVYASGVQMGGSSEAYVRDMQSEQARELQWLKDATEQRARAIEKGAAVGLQAGRIGAVAGAAKGVSGGLGML